MNKVAAIIVAAGRGSRTGSSLPKQWHSLGDCRVLEHAIACFRDICDDIIVVHHPDDAALAASLKEVTLAHGGATRAASVQSGLKALSGKGIQKVLIHDAARALTPKSVILDVINALDHSAGAAPGLPVTDALWRSDPSEDAAIVSQTADRSGLYRAQTPQGFDYDTILKAHEQGDSSAADDVELALSIGARVTITEGSEENFKITYPEDFERARRLLAERSNETRQDRPTMNIRLGNGYDVHRFGEGDHVWLCGVKVAHNRSLQGHSDADVGMHALTDAIYGALAEGDIGQHFPPSDMKWKGAESHIFLRHAIELARSKGYEMSNCDVTLICERPKIGPHAAEMRAALTEIMSVDISCVSVKATTSERLGFTGREEGIAAQATACLVAQNA